MANLVLTESGLWQRLRNGPGFTGRLNNIWTSPLSSQQVFPHERIERSMGVRANEALQIPMVHRCPPEQTPAPEVAIPLDHSTLSNPDLVFEMPGEIVPMPRWKRSVDVTGAAIGLVVLLPLWLVICLVISLDSPGGPLFRQRRVGHGGRVFVCWKFRSMHRGADRMLAQLSAQNEASGQIFKMREDPRRTRVGKVLRRTSVDEFPQLINVLCGQMSLVGPRPPMITEVMNYEPDERRRLATVPGMTGLWQVSLRGRHEFADMVALDVEYARRLSPSLDAQILLRTIPTVIFGRGSY